MAGDGDQAASGVPVVDGYEQLALIGRGGFAAVYRARETTFNRDVAIKVLELGELSDEAMNRFERECKAVGSLSGHPNIVTVYGAGRTSTGRPYIAMELSGKGSYRSKIERDGPLTGEQATRTGIELLDAVGAAHDIGILHRDIKPDNVLISRYDRPQLTDFGISSIPGGYETATGDVSATMAFAPPEVIDGARATPACDLYSLGATIASLMIGEPVFARRPDEALVAYMRRVIQDPPPDLTSYGASPELSNVLRRSMAKDPAERYQTAASFRDALNVVPEIGIVTGPPPTPTFVDPPPAPSAALPAPAEVTRRRGELLAPGPATPPVLAPESATMRRTVTPTPIAEPKRSRRGLLIAAAVGAVVVIGGIAAVALSSTGNKASTAKSSTNPSPVAAATSGPGLDAPATSFTCTGTDCMFAVTGSITAGEQVTWDFGDGHSSSTAGSATEHNYAKAGTYTTNVTGSVAGITSPNETFTVAIAQGALKITLRKGSGDLDLVASVAGSKDCLGGIYDLQEQRGGWQRVDGGYLASTVKLTARSAGTYRLSVNAVGAGSTVCPSATSSAVVLKTAAVTSTQTYTAPVHQAPPATIYTPPPPVTVYTPGTPKG